MSSETGDGVRQWFLRRGYGTLWVVGLIVGTLLLLSQSAAATIGTEPVLNALSVPVLETSIAETLRDADGIIQYALIFVLAAIPWLEIVVVIPIGVALGINPFGVALFAFLGNVLPIYGIIAFYVRLKAALGWDQPDPNSTTSRRNDWAKRIWNRFGLPGLALASPVVIGVHLATVIALALRSKKRTVALWMTVSVFVWTVALTASAYYGIESIQAIVE
ncbi:small multi-drug export protein (plasmid) [Haloferacaceae archaeon DSL9]